MVEAEDPGQAAQYRRTVRWRAAHTTQPQDLPGSHSNQDCGVGKRVDHLNGIESPEIDPRG